MAVSRFPSATIRQTDFTSSGTWTAPSGVYSAEFLVVGAGGGGGGLGGQVVTDNAAGGGGGGGAVKKINLSVSPGTSYTITIGALGAGGSAAPGGNGGFSEVLNGATSLIKAYGGQGGAGMTAGALVTPTVSTTLGAGGGLSGNAVGTQLGGGGGGSLMNGFRNAATTSSLGIEGGSGNAISTSAVNAGAILSSGAYGIDGYGAGGGGGAATATVTFKLGVAGSSFGAAGGQRTSSGTAAGSVPVANTGCGGGGAAAFTNTTTVAGGNGSDGLVRVVYFG